MSTTKFTVGLVGLMLALAVGTTVHETYASFRAGAALAATYREIAVLSGRLQELRDHAKTAESASPGPKSTDEARTVEPPAAPHDPAAAGRAFLTRHPEVKQALVERARARVAGKYRSFYKAWELSPAQIAQFETLMMENEGWSTTGPDGALLLQPGDGLTASEVKNRMHDLLGDTVFPLFEDATHRALGIRQAVLELASATYFTDTPLTAQQADQLIQRGLEMRGVMSQLGAYMRSNPLAGPTVAEILLTETADVLTDTQLAALDGVIQQLQFRDSLGRALRQSAPPPPTGDAKPTP